MQLVRFKHEAEERWGDLAGGEILVLEGEPGGSLRPTGRRVPLAGARLLAPCRPSKIVCVGLNYRDHAEELGEKLPERPVLFLKPPSAVIGPGETIVKPGLCRRLDYEGELAVVIGRTARQVPVEEALDCVLGYTCANDVTARDLQPKDGQWTLSKSFDTFCPLGPAVVTGIDPADLEITVRVNGETRQHSRTSRLIFGVAELVSFISHVMTLWPGDVILTGTPGGIGSLEPGDTVEVEISQVGLLENRVGVARPAGAEGRP